MNLFWLLRMKRWVQNPPSWGRVKLVAAIAMICVGIALFEYFFGWPDALTLDGSNGRRFLRF